MPCYHPLSGYRSRAVNSRTGRRAIVFNPQDGYRDLPVTVPCGQCVGCRLERSRQWAVRCMHEASLYDENCFITLTYDDAHLPAWGSLDKKAFPAFMKRLRKWIAPRKVRYYHAGEYGDLRGRPHYHACLFGFDFVDKRERGMRSGFPVWSSATLEALWPLGRSEIGSVTFESAAYVARYIMKKVTGQNAEEAYTVVNQETGELGRQEPEYTTMSRRPGIGVPWLRKYLTEVYPADGVVMRGRLMKPPRFYDMAFELLDPTGAEAVCRARLRRRRREDETPERLADREQVELARLNLLRRGLE